MQLCACVDKLNSYIFKEERRKRLWQNWPTTIRVGQTNHTRALSVDPTALIFNRSSPSSSPTLISLMVPVDVKHPVYLLLSSLSSRTQFAQATEPRLTSKATLPIKLQTNGGQVIPLAPPAVKICWRAVVYKRKMWDGCRRRRRRARESERQTDRERDGE